MAKRGTLTHRKTRRLARCLGGIPLPYALGIVEALWHATQTHAPDGAIGRLSDDDIAEEMWWDDEPSKLVAALVESGFVDEHPDHRLIVHGWAEHADAPTHMAIARRRQRFASGEIPNISRLPAAERREAEAYYSDLCAQRAHAVRTDGDSVRTDPASVRTELHGVRTPAAFPAPPRPAPLEAEHTHTPREANSEPEPGAESEPDPPLRLTIVNHTPVVVHGDRGVPPNFAPDAGNAQLAVDLGLETAVEVELFVAHALDHARQSNDWQAAFRRWLRESGKRAEQAARASPRPYSGGPKRLTLDEALAQAKADSLQREAARAAQKASVG